ncbi:MAG: hypothetical protein IPK79_00200 [Vampirovibrionales bacterium]|nr:hypothetical protein [Vampirovibrionales bacterium]
MKHSAQLDDYIAANESAIRTNPPRNNPAYADDPIAVWRYYMRVFGYGLAGFDEKEATDAIKLLYSRWFVFLEFNSKMPKIDNHLFLGWIRDAMREAQAGDARRKAQRSKVIKVEQGALAYGD